MIARSYRLLLHSLLLGGSLSSFGLALMLVYLLERFAKDLAEVLATWEVVHSCIVVGLAFFVAWCLSLRTAR